MSHGWWTDVDDEVMACLRDRATATPGEIGERVNLSPEAVTSVLCLLAQEGKVRICVVAANGAAVATLADAA